MKNIGKFLAIVGACVIQACAPASSTFDCQKPNILLDSEAVFVSQETDNSGQPFQTITLRTSSPIAASNELSREPAMFSLFVNGIRQNTYIYQGRAVGVERVSPTSIPTTSEATSCSAAFAYNVRLGFGNIPFASGDSGFSYVGRQLQQGETLTLRLDVCSADPSVGCIEGIPQVVVVSLSPSSR